MSLLTDDWPVLTGKLSHYLGFDLPPHRGQDLQNALREASRDLAYASPQAFHEWLVAHDWGDREVRAIATYLTVGETYFHRDGESLAMLCEHVLAPLVEQRRRSGRYLRIWSAGCSTGEEPYMLAILLHRIVPDIADWNLHLLATDINPTALDRAIAGKYREWAFREAPEWLRRSYFASLPDGQTQQLIPAIRDLVQFRFLNLADATYPSLLNDTNAMDVIVCRNVLIYFGAEQQAQVVQRLSHALVPGGYLVTSPSESYSERFVGLAPTRYGTRTFYCKQAAAPAKPRPEASRQRPVMPLPQPRPAPPQRPPQPLARRPAPAPPEKPASALEQARASYASGDYPATIASLEAAAQLDVAGLTLLTRAHANLGRWTEAVAAIQQALTRDKLNPSLHFLEANLHQEQGQQGPAIAALQRAIYLDPTFVIAHLSLAMLYRHHGPNPAAAERHLRSATALLRQLPADAPIPESEGLLAGQLLHQFHLLSTEAPVHD